MKAHPEFLHYDTKGRCRDFGTLSRPEAAALLREWRQDDLTIPRIERAPTHRQYCLLMPGGSSLIITIHSLH